MAPTPNHYLVILCGGTGPRLWPLSKTNHPKQFLPILSSKSLLEQTISRCRKIVPKKQIFLVSNQKYLPYLKQYLNHHILPKNILAEPEKKNTAMAILYAAAFINQLDPQAVITSLPSDHYIKATLAFKQTLRRAAKQAITTNTLVALAASPLFVNPSYGYLKAKRQKITKFIEKPPRPKIPRLIQDGFLWNLGVYTFTAANLINQFKSLQPQYYRLYAQLKNNLDQPPVIKKIYQAAPNLSIDVAICQKSTQLSLVKVNFKWSDVGEWKTIYFHSPKDSHGHAFLNQHTLLAQHQSKNCLIYGQKNKLIGLVGVDNLAIIDTPQALLVCHLPHSFQVRNLVTKIVSQPQQKHFFVAKNDQ